MVSIQASAHLKHELLYFLTTENWEFFVYPGYMILIFFPLIAYFLILFRVSFTEPKLFILMRVRLFCPSFMVCAFDVISEIVYLTQVTERSCSLLSPLGDSNTELSRRSKTIVIQEAHVPQKSVKNPETNLHPSLGSDINGCMWSIWEADLCRSAFTKNWGTSQRQTSWPPIKVHPKEKGRCLELKTRRKCQMWAFKLKPLTMTSQ